MKVHILETGLDIFIFCLIFKTGTVALIQTRWLNLQEYQSKTLMADNGLHVQRFKVTDNAEEAVQIAKELSKFETLRRKSGSEHCKNP